MATKLNVATTTDARILRSREALRGALLTLLKTRPFEEITIRDIVAEAGIGYTTFFRHHPTKEALLDDIAEDEITRLVAITLPLIDGVDTSSASKRLCTYVDQNRTLWSVLLAGGAAATLREEFIAQSTRVAHARRDLWNWLPQDIGTLLVVSSTLEILKWWLQQKKPMSVAKVAELLDRMVVHPTVNQD
jgi:AcrR family transcriptional regulator